MIRDSSPSASASSAWTPRMSRPSRSSSTIPAGREIRRIPRCRGVPDGSDTPMSRDRIEGFTNEARELGVEIVDSVEALIERSDRS